MASVNGEPTEDSFPNHKKITMDINETLKDTAKPLKDGIDNFSNDTSDKNTEKNGEYEDATGEKTKATFTERWKNQEYRNKCIRTIWLAVSFWALGFSIGQRGPAFLDIQIITQTTVEEASFFFTAASVGYLVGSLVAGVVYDKLNKSVLLLLCVFGLAVTTVVLPWCSIYVLMITIHFLSALFAAGLDTAGNAELVRIWSTEGEMAMQFLHFSYALGGVVGPLVTAPFLTPNPEDIEPNITNSSADQKNPALTTQEPNVNSTAPVLPQTTIVHYAYLISGCTIFLVCLPLTWQWFTDRLQKRRQDHGNKVPPVTQPLPTLLFMFVMSLLFLMYFLYCATEDTFAIYLATFVVKGLHWSKSNGAQITSLYWTSFAVIRFSCIFVVHFLSSVKLLFLCFMTLILSLLAFLLFSQFHIVEGIWLASFMTGASLAPVFATGFTWMESELVKVTGRVASAILIAASSGTMTNPIVLGYLMEEYTPMWFSYLLFGEAFLCVSVFLFLLAFSRIYIKKYYTIHAIHVETELEVRLENHAIMKINTEEPVLS